MKSLMLCVLLVFASGPVSAKNYCEKKGKTKISCDGVAGAEKKGFCWKGKKISNDKKISMCKKHHKKATKAKKA